MSNKKPSRLLSLLAAIVIAMVATTTVWAATANFTIHKVDDSNKPLEGVSFEIYGKPTLTVEEPELTSITVTKVWEDGTNVEGKRPSADELASALHLYAGEEEVSGFTPEITETDENTWSVTYSDLPKCDDSGEEIAYTVTEDEIEGYVALGTPAADGETITNRIPTSVRFFKKWGVYSTRYEDKIVPAEDYAQFVDLWMTTDEDYNASKPEALSQDAYSQVDDAPTPVVTEIMRKKVKNYDATGLDVRYQIVYNNVPKYADDGTEINYVMRENHVVGLQIFGGDGSDGKTPLAMAFDPYGINYERPITYDELRALHYSEAEAQGFIDEGGWTYLDFMPIIGIRNNHAFYGVGEGGTIENIVAGILDGIHLIG